MLRPWSYLSIGFEKGDLLKFQVNIKNTGCGHYLPTGLTELRQMWLEISVTDAEGKIVYLDGKMDEREY